MKQRHRTHHVLMLAHSRQTSVFASTVPLPSFTTLKTFLLFIALLLIAIVDTVGQPALAKTRVMILNAVLPLHTIGEAPALFMRRHWQLLDNHLHVYTQNQQLRQRLRLATADTATIPVLAYENKQLRQLLHTVPSHAQYTTARLVMGGAQGQLALIKTDETHPIISNSLVLVNGVVMGRVLTVTGNTASVIPITALDSRLPVRIAETGEPLLLVGSSTGLDIRFVGDHHTLPRHSTLITASVGGLPAGLPVATMTTTTNNTLTITPLFDIHDVDWVVLLPPTPIAP
jgi:rod shape-determining protein MreC